MRTKSRLLLGGVNEGMHAGGSTHNNCVEEALNDFLKETRTNPEGTNSLCMPLTSLKKDRAYL